MVESPPTPAAKPKANEETKTSLLPQSSLYPTLTSGQVTFTTAAAIRDIIQVPTHVYRIQVDLKPRTKESNFSKDPWTLVAKHFFASLLSFDEKAIILKKKGTAPVNKLSSPDELPENPELFERDYAYDVNHRGPRLVTFKLIIATSRNFWNTFKNPTTFYKKLLINEWYVKLVRLESQGTTAEIGHLMYGHTRFMNQEDIIDEIKLLIHPTKCNDIDVRTTKSKETYYDDDGRKQEVITKWPTIVCPIDIAKKLSTLLMEKWDDLEKSEDERLYNIKNMVFIPKDRDLVPFNARIQNMAKQNEFLKTYREITVLSNCGDLNTNFIYTEEVVEAIGSIDRRGHILSLKKFLGTWEDQTTGNPAIYSISRTTRDDEYALLTGATHSKDIHNRIESLIMAIKKQTAFKNIKIGGTKGAMGKKRFSTSVQQYAKKQFTTDKVYNQRPPKSKIPPTSPNEWRKPPKERQLQKQPTPSLTINLDDRRQRQQYSDVLQNPYNRVNNNGSNMSISNTTGTISVGNTTSTNSLVPLTPTAVNKTNEKGNHTVVTQSQINNFLESRDFQETLAKIVAPQVAQQVNDLITPSVEKLDTIEVQVKELHNYVDDNKKWQSQQTSRQTDFQQNMNVMASTMNSMGGKIDKLVGLFQTNSLEEDGHSGKRAVDKLSPDHHAKHNNAQKQKAKRQYQHEEQATPPIHMEQSAQSGGMTSTLSPLQTFNSHPSTTDEDMSSPQERYEGAGKEQ
jgi:hypothetical protein